MSDTPMTRLHINSTRTKAGKVMDTWELRLQDEIAKIEVRLHSDQTGMHFEAKSDHPALRGEVWQSRDIMDLRERVSGEAELAVRDWLAQEWEPAIVVKTEASLEDNPTSTKTSIILETKDLYVDPVKPVGNRGETRVLVGTQSRVLYQRAYDQDFSNGRTLSQEDIALSREDNRTLARAVRPEGDQARLDMLHQALRTFSIHLMKRMAPDILHADGIPDPEELIGLMQAAVENPEHVEEKRDESGFRF